MFKRLGKKSVDIKSLKPGDTITIKTVYHEYKLKVIDPALAKVEVTSEDSFSVPIPTTMYVYHSFSLKGEKGETAIIVKGHRLEMSGLETSIVKKIFLEEK